jgi:hypothetical protein
MSEMKNVSGILAVINSITANRESGRLEIDASGTPGTFLFNDGKLVHASLGSLKGFPAVNAAVALRDAQFIFDHVAPASHVSTISPSERVVLKRFFGIEAADMEEPKDTIEPDWNPAPEPVVPLAEVEETPTVEVAAPVRSRSFAFFSKPVIAASLALLLALAVGAIALRSRMKARQEVASVATVVQPESVQPESSSVPEPQPEVKPEAVRSVAVSQPREREAKVQDLTGDWRIINTVQKTAYKSYGNMQVGFRLRIKQQGKQFTAKGEKFSENGQTLPAASRTPIEVTGSIEGDKVIATFVEDGRMRRTNGRFVWRVQNGGDGLAGTFVSTAANSSGRSAVTKQ